MFNPCRDHCMIYRGRSYNNDCDKTCEYTKAIKGLQYNELSVYNMLNKIKSYDAPPWDDNDIYYHRSPWQKFGGVSSGIVMCWCWYRDSVILEQASVNDIIQAYREITKEGDNTYDDDSNEN